MQVWMLPKSTVAIMTPKICSSVITWMPPSRSVAPNHCSGDHKCSASSLEVLPQKFEIHNILCKQIKFDFRYEGFLDNFLASAPQPLKGWETLK